MSIVNELMNTYLVLVDMCDTGEITSDLITQFNLDMQTFDDYAATEQEIAELLHGYNI